MRTVGTKLVGLVTSLLVAGSAYASSDSDKELAEMRALVEELGQKVDAQQEQLEHQGGLLQDAQKVVREQQEENGALSGVGEFWQAIDVNMSVAGSYAYNFHNPTPHSIDTDLDGTPDVDTSDNTGAGQNSGRSGFFYPFHPDHNSFQVDQVWFDIAKETTDESRAGFHATILYGTTASFLGQTSPSDARSLRGDGDDDGFDGTSDYYVHQAFVQYLAPVGEGVEFTFGKFATPIGAEVADAAKNWAVTRGNLYNLMQPIDHLGLMASTDVGPVTLGAGVVNQINLLTSSPDVNSEKSYLGRIAIAPSDMFSVATTVAYGAESPAFTVGSNGGGDNDRTGMVDVLANFTSDAFSAYLNADYAWVEGTSLAAWGVSVAGQVPITDVLSAALRLEYLRDKHNNSGTANFFPILSSDQHSEIYGATGTLAYEIAENLTIKGEVRWDHVNEDVQGFDEFITNTNGGSDEQTVGLAQVIYAF